MTRTVGKQNGLPLNMSSSLLCVQEGIETEGHQLGERWRRKRNVLVSPYCSKSLSHYYSLGDFYIKSVFWVLLKIRCTNTRSSFLPVSQSTGASFLILFALGCAFQLSKVFPTHTMHTLYLASLIHFQEALEFETLNVEETQLLNEGTIPTALSF